jgi:hypothetical protein
MLALGRSPSSCGGGTRVSLVFVFVVTAAYVARGYPLALGPDFLSLGFAIVSAAFAVERVQEHLGYGAAVAAQRPPLRARRNRSTVRSSLGLKLAMTWFSCRRPKRVDCA